MKQDHLQGGPLPVINGDTTPISRDMPPQLSIYKSIFMVDKTPFIGDITPVTHGFYPSASGKSFGPGQDR